MTIVDEIQRIKNNISNAYDICEQKGATIPDSRNSENLASCIVSITTNDNIFGVPLEIDSDGNLARPSDYTWTSDTAKTISTNALSYIFSNSTGLKSVDFPLVENIKRYGLSYAFQNCTSLQNVNAPNLKTIENDGMEYAFNNCTSLKSVSFPNLNEIQSYGLRDAFNECSSLSTVNLPELVTVHSNGLYYAFDNCSSITDIVFPKLTTLHSNALYCAFKYCTNLKTASFPELKTLNNSSLSYCFQNCTNLKQIYFNGLTEETFSSTVSTSMFFNMLSSVTGCTVHFPAELSTILKSYSDVINGFGGTDTIVIFDINGATINFIVSNSDNYNIFVNGEESESSAVYDLTDKKYIVLDSNTNKIVVGDINDVQPNTNTDITVDFSQNFKRVNVTTNVSGASVVFNIGGATLPAKTDDNNNYYLEISGSNTDVMYIISAPDCMGASGTITFEGEDINVLQRLYPAISQKFSQKYLVEDGTMGGKSFAVTCDTTSTSRYAYQALDNSYSTYALVNKSPYSYTLYSPNPINITKLTNSFYSSSYSPVTTMIYGSNDGQNYTHITTASFSYEDDQNITLPNTEYYNYYKLVFIKQSSDIEFTYMLITATELVAKKSLTYKITSNNAYSVYFNDTELTQDTGGFDDCFVVLNDEDILETNVFKIVQNGNIVYQTLVDFDDADSKNNYYIGVDLTQQCTLTLVPDKTASSYKYIVNGIESSESSNKITVVKGSTISYSIEYTDTNYVTSSGEITLNENKTINIVAKKYYVKVDLHPDTSRYAWRETTIANPTSYAMYESTNKGISSSNSMMKVTFKGYSSFTCYINSYAESSSDYTYATQLNQELSKVNSDHTYNTSGSQKNPTSLSAFTKVTYTNLEPTSEYFFYVVYKKDGSVNSYNDTGYFIIDLYQEGSI